MACRKDGKGRVLRKGEHYRKTDGRYSYIYTDPLGKKRTIYAKSLVTLRQKEDELVRDQMDGLNVYVPDALCGLLHIPYSFRDNDRLSGKDSDLCLYTPYEIPLQILLAVSVPRHGFPYEILPLHPVLSGSLQSSCYYSASISTIRHFLINSYLHFHSF
jgi:hypothetical protein